MHLTHGSFFFYSCPRRHSSTTVYVDVTTNPLSMAGVAIKQKRRNERAQELRQKQVVFIFGVCHMSALDACLSSLLLVACSLSGLGPKTDSKGYTQEIG